MPSSSTSAVAPLGIGAQFNDRGTKKSLQFARYYNHNPTGVLNDLNRNYMIVQKKEKKDPKVAILILVTVPADAYNLRNDGKIKPFKIQTKRNVDAIVKRRRLLIG